MVRGPVRNCSYCSENLDARFGCQRRSKAVLVHPIAAPLTIGSLLSVERGACMGTVRRRRVSD